VWALVVVEALLGGVLFVSVHQGVDTFLVLGLFSTAPVQEWYRPPALQATVAASRLV
jgi:hypothetical protein